MKTTIRIPTTTYGFVEVEVEATCFDEIKDKHDELYGLMNQKVGDGLLDREWREIKLAYLRGDGTNAETWAKMNKYQQDWIQDIKRSFKQMKDNLEQ